MLPGRHDVACNQLLWSPDGSQLIYAAWASERGLTQADNLQHGWTVIDLRSGRVLVTVQNHGYAVSAADAELVTHVSLNDGTVEGLAGEDFASVQFHPEAAPGPLDALPFFEEISRVCHGAGTFALS